MEMPEQREKYAWRAKILANRAAVAPAVRDAESAALATAVATLGIRGWVCGYVPVRGEPGSTDMLDALRMAGARVLVPVTGPAGPLSWAEYTGPNGLHRARFGLLEPTTEVLSPGAVGRADVILVPALAVDRRGIRLGWGAGYYDRTLAAARPNARLIAVVRDDELVERLPKEPHDLRVGWALTPHGGLHRLGGERVAK